MKPDIVVDVGNSRVKWGRCGDGAVVESMSLPHSEAAWQEQVERWGLGGALRWVVASVQPRTADLMAGWACRRGDAVVSLETARQLPLQVLVDKPDWVGIDRLLNAVAANTRRRPGVPAVVVDAGSAVTVDFVDRTGAFRGGSIFPGLRLMCQALHDHTALLPLIQVSQPLPPVPATSTPTAMEAGVYWAVAGGIDALVRRLQAAAGVAPEVFLAGGDAALLEPGLQTRATLWPLITLEGIRMAAEVLP
jgi:type III pantothenate kinase